jgi:hypothetical protein
MKGILRSEMNQLMAIPEVRQVIEAKFIELRLIFKHKLREQAEQNLQEAEVSNIICFPHSCNLTPGLETATPSRDGDNTDGIGPEIIKIVDASRFKYVPEEERVKIFMDYFKNHRGLRKAMLDEFFLRILPYSEIDSSGFPTAKTPMA